MMPNKQRSGDQSIELREGKPGTISTVPSYLLPAFSFQ
jgi:hypothetical protein